MQAKYAEFGWLGCSVNAITFQVNLLNQCKEANLSIASSIFVDPNIPIPYSVQIEGTPETLEILVATPRDHLVLDP